MRAGASRREVCLTQRHRSPVESVRIRRAWRRGLDGMGSGARWGCQARRSWGVLAVGAVVGGPEPARLAQAGAAGVADRGAAAFVFVVGGDVADAGVQALRVVDVAHRGELG